MKKILLVVLMLIILFTLQAKKKKVKPPAWLENPKAVYSEQMYLSAIGEGDSRREAENIAAGNLSKIFESKVKTDETVVQRYMELTKGDEFTYEDQTDVTKSVNIQSEQTLFNIQFAESYTNEMGRVFVLAYLNRMKTAEIYGEKINKNTESVTYFTKLCDGSDDPMMKYAAMSAASAVGMSNEVLLEQLGIIFPTSKEMLEINYNYNDLMKKTAEVAKQLSFKIDIKNDTENKISILVEELLTD
ncbi:MAG: LPP20 family lipoprotein, partial [Candidatus Cloacimonetes bacterium]|nr:LPP20 family lipoprotein [Candidatus Cloacimonadota bacterium]